MYMCTHMCGYKQVHTRSFFDRSANAFYEIGLVNGIELMYTEREKERERVTRADWWDGLVGSLLGCDRLSVTI